MPNECALVGRGIRIRAVSARLLAEYAACLGDFGEIAEALYALDDLVARCERAEEQWYLPELLRMKGERILGRGAGDSVSVAERHFTEALGLAQQQGALS